jgi:hypothetical protein
MNEKLRTSTNKSKLILPVMRKSALISINVVPPTTTPPFNVGVLNVQSLGNKAASINSCIVDNQLDVFAVVESWHDSFETPSVIAATPPDYRVIERARPRSEKPEITVEHNYGGICVFVRRCLKLKLVHFPLYSTFELLSLFIVNQPIASLLLVVYRPGSKPPTVKFIEEFDDLLERSSSYNHCIIAGDVNVHLDDPTALHVSQFLQLLEDFGLSELVRQSTHKIGHQLDVLITRTIQPVSAVKIYPPLQLSDHSLIIATFTGPDKSVVPRRPRIKRRCWKKFDVDAFTIDLLKSDLNVRPPVESLNSSTATTTR